MGQDMGISALEEALPPLRGTGLAVRDLVTSEPGQFSWLRGRLLSHHHGPGFCIAPKETVPSIKQSS